MGLIEDVAAALDAARCPASIEIQLCYWSTGYYLLPRERPAPGVQVYHWFAEPSDWTRCTLEEKSVCMDVLVHYGNVLRVAGFQVEAPALDWTEERPYLLVSRPPLHLDSKPALVIRTPMQEYHAAIVADGGLN